MGYSGFRPGDNGNPLPWISKEARLSGCWIYHTTTKKWYTPDEFEKVAYTLYKSNTVNQNNAHEFKIMTPQLGIEQRLRFLKKVTDELLEFKKKVDDYFITEMKKK